MLSKNTPARLKGTARAAAASALAAATDACTHACTLPLEWTNVTRHCIFMPSASCIYTDSTLCALPFWDRGRSGKTKSLLGYSSLSKRSKVLLQEKS